MTFFCWLFAKSLWAFWKIKNSQLKTKNSKKGWWFNKWKNSKSFFFDEKRHKMLIKVVGPDCDNTVLVFDMKNDCFYFQENLLPPSAPSFDRLQFVSGRNGVIYAIHCYYSTPVELFKTEMIKFNLENGSLVHDGVMWETDDGAREYPKIKRITLACFVWDELLMMGKVVYIIYVWKLKFSLALEVTMLLLSIILCIW